MAGYQSSFDEFIANDIAKYSSISIPLRSGLLRRLFVKKQKCKNLHPNPEDEFCFPDVGPSYRIISEYEQKYLNQTYHNLPYYGSEDPIIVEKIYPEGYRILNGHHRWAAALRLGYRTIPIQIVNVSHNQDIKEIVVNSKHNKRVTLDLDEVVFSNYYNGPQERPLIFPLNKIYKERLRKGIPALFRMLNKNGFDIWVYSNKFYSNDYIKWLFRSYHVAVTGIVTGTDKRKDKKEREAMKELYSDKYKFSLLLDNSLILMIDNINKDFREFVINDISNWSKEVMDIIREIDKDEEI